MKYHIEKPNFRLDVEVNTPEGKTEKYVQDMLELYLHLALGHLKGPTELQDIYRQRATKFGEENLQLLREFSAGNLESNLDDSKLN